MKNEDIIISIGIFYGLIGVLSGGYLAPAVICFYEHGVVLGCFWLLFGVPFWYCIFNK